MKTGIYIATYEEDGEPILTSFNEVDLLNELDKWNGVDDRGLVKRIHNAEIIYDEYPGTLIREIVYETNISGANYTTKYKIWIIGVDLKNIPNKSEHRAACECGSVVFIKVKPEDVKSPYKEYGSKHYYKCSSCGKQYWSFFFNMETENKKIWEN